MEFWTLSRRLGFHKLGDLAEAPVKLLDHLYPGRVSQTLNPEPYNVLSTARVRGSVHPGVCGR